MSIERAREMRKEPTEPERRMWAPLYTFRNAGMHWRRQVPLGPYFADFACHDPQIVIEVDGDTHGLAVAYDQARDRYMIERGYRVLRFSNGDVMSNAEGVYAAIEAAVAESSPHPVPPPQGGRRSSRSAVATSTAEHAVPSSPPPLRGRDRVGGEP